MTFGHCHLSSKKHDKNVGLATAHPSLDQFQQKCLSVLRSELHEKIEERRALMPPQ